MVWFRCAFHFCPITPLCSPPHQTPSCPTHSLCHPIRHLLMHSSIRSSMPSLGAGPSPPVGHRSLLAAHLIPLHRTSLPAHLIPLHLPPCTPHTTAPPSLHTSYHCTSLPAHLTLLHLPPCTAHTTAPPSLHSSYHCTSLPAQLIPLQRYERAKVSCEGKLRR
jgi:hypothetical protein